MTGDEQRDEIRVAAGIEEQPEAPPPPEWAIVEVFGHRRHGGLIQEVERFGAKFVRVDVPGDKDGEVYATHFYSGPSIFSITPTDEATARRVAAYERPRPTTQYQLPAPEGEDDEAGLDR